MSDDDFRYHQAPSLLSSDEASGKKKSRSLDTDRRLNNVNKRQYKLEQPNQEIAQDFLEEYKGETFHAEPLPDVTRATSQPRLSLLSGKVYESDGSDSFEKAGTVQTQEDDEEYIFYNPVKQRSLVERMCQCFYSYSSQVDQSGGSPQDEESVSMKPCGMFGEKTFRQVCDDLRAKSPYKQTQGHGFISLIVKSGDDLRQE